MWLWPLPAVTEAAATAVEVEGAAVPMQRPRQQLVPER